MQSTANSTLMDYHTVCFSWCPSSWHRQPIPTRIVHALCAGHCGLWAPQCSALKGGESVAVASAPAVYIPFPPPFFCRSGCLEHEVKRRPSTLSVIRKKIPPLFGFSVVWGSLQADSENIYAFIFSIFSFLECHGTNVVDIIDGQKRRGLNYFFQGFQSF